MPFHNSAYKFLILTLLILSVFIGNSQKNTTLFKLLPSLQTGVAFKNTITENDKLNILNEAYIYNGGGVGIGDFNNDGLEDIYFSGNMVSNKLYHDSGPYLAALITYYAFVSLFPLLLLTSTVLSYLLRGDPELQERLINSALSQFPVVGDQLGTPRALSGGVGGVVIGSLVAIYGALGVAQAAQYAMNTAWSVPRNKRPNPFLARARSLLLLGAGGLMVLGSFALSSIGAGNAGSFGPLLRALVLVGSLVLGATVFLLVFRLATSRPLTARQVLPGALLAAVAWQLLQTFGVAYVKHVVRNASATNGVFALVLGLLAFLYLAATAVVLCVEVNVVRVDRLHPRALLTPFTDDVQLTSGDRRSYTGQAKAQRQKGFERVDVTFEAPQDAGEEPDVYQHVHQGEPPADDGPGPR